MKIHLDDEPAVLTGEDLPAILMSAQAKLQGLGRTVVEVQIDGRVIAGDELHQFMQQGKLPAESELRLYSADPRLLAGEVLRQVNEQLDLAQDAQHAAADAFAKDHTTAGIEQVGQAVNIWLQVQQAVTHSCAMAQINLDDRIFEGQPVNVHIQQLVNRIKNLRDLLTQRDTLGLADTLSYEWPEMTELWQRLVGQMILWIQS
jgi:hypothetical protein